MQFPSWYLTILLYFIFGTAFSLLQRKIAQRTELPLKFLPALMFAVVVYPAALIYALVSGNIQIHYVPQLIPLLLVASLSFGSASALLFGFNKHVDATQYIIISNIYTPLAVLLGVFLLREPFTRIQFLGMTLLLLGGILVAAKGFRPKTFRFNEYSLGLAGVSLLMGIGLTAERASLNYMTAQAYMIVGWGIQTIVMALFAGKDWRLLSKLRKIDWVDIFKIGIARTGHVIGFLLSVALSRNVALIATVSSYRIPLVFIASFFLLKERDHLFRKIIGVAIATVGLLLL